MATGIFEDLVDSIFGKADTSKEDAEATQAISGLKNTFAGITAPNRSVTAPTEYKDLGTYSPTTITAPDKIGYSLGDAAQADIPIVGDTSYKDISIDPRLKDSQYSALAQLEEIVKGGGLSAKDRADLARVQSDVAQADRGRREAILQNLGARGMAGGGMELLSQLQSNQAATDRASQAGLDIAGLAQQRALDAIMQQGSLAGSMRSQDYGEQAKLAEAKDLITRFNASNTLVGNIANTKAVNDFAVQRATGNLDANKFNAGMDFDVNKFNAGQTTDAAKFGKISAQDTSNKNVDIGNAYKERVDALPGQQFTDKMALGNAKAGTAQPIINYYDSAADRKIQEQAAKQAAKIGLLTGTASAAAQAYGGKKKE